MRLVDDFDMRRIETGPELRFEGFTHDSVLLGNPRIRSAQVLLFGESEVHLACLQAVF
jgi:hypothetical protein